MTYFAYVTQITNLRPIPKADNLIVGDCFNQEVVVGKDTVEGQIGIFFPADGRLSQGYLEANNLIRTVHPDGTKTGTFDANGKVRIQKLRGQKSNGYFASLDSLRYTGGDISSLTLGTEFNEFNGVKFCEKYVVQAGRPRAQQSPTRIEKSKFLFFRKHHDTERILYKLDNIEKGMKLVFTEKLHGTSQRSAHALESQQSWWGALINGLCKRTIIKPTLTWKYVCGTRNTTIKDWEKHVGYYKEREGFRKEMHDKYFADKLLSGETVYYEIVGYTSGDSLIMAEGNTSKLQDKALLKKYGEKMRFTYGCEPGEHEVYVYRMSMTSLDGIETDYNTAYTKQRCVELGVKFVPIIYEYTFEGDIDDLVAKCKEFANGESILDSRHIKEGVVIRNDESKWQAWKYKSFEFDVLEDNIKLTGVEDIEEQS